MNIENKSPRLIKCVTNAVCQDHLRNDTSILKRKQEVPPHSQQLQQWDRFLQQKVVNRNIFMKHLSQLYNKHEWQWYPMHCFVLFPHQWLPIADFASQAAALFSTMQSLNFRLNYSHLLVNIIFLATVLGQHGSSKPSDPLWCWHCCPPTRRLSPPQSHSLRLGGNWVSRKILRQALVRLNLSGPTSPFLMSEDSGDKLQHSGRRGGWFSTNKASISSSWASQCVLRVCV